MKYSTKQTLYHFSLGNFNYFQVMKRLRCNTYLITLKSCMKQVSHSITQYNRQFLQIKLQSHRVGQGFKLLDLVKDVPAHSWGILLNHLQTIFQCKPFYENMFSECT